MALENAKKYLQMIRDDQKLRDRLSGKKPEDGIRIARGLGLDFTDEEMKEALKTCELSIDEMKEAAGGRVDCPSDGIVGTHTEDRCPNDPNGKHDWIKRGHREEPHTFLFWDYTLGYDECVCSRCGKVKDVPT